MIIKKHELFFVKKNSRLIYKVASFENFTVGEFKILIKARSIDDHENMSRQQLESFFTTPSKYFYGNYNKTRKFYTFLKPNG